MRVVTLAWPRKAICFPCEYHCCVERRLCKWFSSGRIDQINRYRLWPRHLHYFAKLRSKLFSILQGKEPVIVYLLNNSYLLQWLNDLIANASIPTAIQAFPSTAMIVQLKFWLRRIWASDVQLANSCSKIGNNLKRYIVKLTRKDAIKAKRLLDKLVTDWSGMAKNGEFGEVRYTCTTFDQRKTCIISSNGNYW